MQDYVLIMHTLRRQRSNFSESWKEFFETENYQNDKKFKYGGGKSHPHPKNVKKCLKFAKFKKNKKLKKIFSIIFRKFYCNKWG